MDGSSSSGVNSPARLAPGGRVKQSPKYDRLENGLNNHKIVNVNEIELADKKDDEPAEADADADADADAAAAAPASARGDRDPSEADSEEPQASSTASLLSPNPSAIKKRYAR